MFLLRAIKALWRHDLASRSVSGIGPSLRDCNIEHGRGGAGLGVRLQTNRLFSDAKKAKRAEVSAGAIPVIVSKYFTR
jgi:hypothetical protein